MSKSSYTPEFRAKVAQEYLNGKDMLSELLKKYKNSKGCEDRETSP